MWTKQRHECNLPMRVHPSVGKLDDIFECEHCKREWQVIAVTKANAFYNDLTFELLNYCPTKVTRGPVV